MTENRWPDPVPWYRERDVVLGLLVALGIVGFVVAVFVQAYGGENNVDSGRTTTRNDAPADVESCGRDPDCVDAFRRLCEDGSDDACIVYDRLRLG